MNDFKRSRVSCLSLYRSACLCIIRYASSGKMKNLSLSLSVSPSLPTPFPLMRPLTRRPPPPVLSHLPAASEALPLPHTNYLPGPNCWVGEVGGKESKMGTWGSVAQLRCTLRMDFPCTWPICSEQVALEATDPKSLVLPRGICPSAKTSPPCST